MSLSDGLERYSAIAQVAWGLLLMRISENKKKAAIGSLALAIILRHLLTRNPSKFISDFSRLAQETKAAADDPSYAFDEYDVIIVGGGQCFTTRPVQLPVVACPHSYVEQGHLAVSWPHASPRTRLCAFCY